MFEWIGRAVRTLAPAPPITGQDYRPDIDGLRALAVLSVFAYHLNIGRVSGGFVGVDIFFVISGYLIGGLIHKELGEGRFSLIGFYERRIRRILPALIAVILTTTIVGYFVIYPTRFAQYGLSVVAAVFSFSNLYFWQTSGYLQGTGTSKALLHTWSLSVEEQFYLALPVFLILVRRFAPRWVIPAVATAAAISLAASIAYVQKDAVAANDAFYLPHTRAWELLLGVLVAIGAFPKLTHAMLRNIAALAGLLLMAGSLVMITNKTPFPGLAAIPPCLGAALVIWAGAGGQSLVGRLFSLPPVVFVGLISYSLYLWHWPLIILRQEWLGDQEAPLTNVDRALLFATALGLAYLTWRFVERPFRKRSMPRRRVFAWTGAGVAGLAACGAALIATVGLPGRYPPEVARIAGWLDYNSAPAFNTGKCFLNTRYSFEDFDQQACLRQSSEKPNVLLVGDSYGAHLHQGLAAVLTGANLLQANAAGCKASAKEFTGLPECTRLARFIVEEYLPTHPVDLIVVSGFWEDHDAEALERFLDYARERNIPVVVAGRPPEYDAPLPALIAKSVESNDHGLVARHARDLLRVDDRFADITERHGAVFVSLQRTLCPAGRCQTMVDGDPIQYDRGHFTPKGSTLAAQKLAPAIAAQLTARGGPA